MHVHPDRSHLFGSFHQLDRGTTGRTRQKRIRAHSAIGPVAGAAKY